MRITELGPGTSSQGHMTSPGVKVTNHLYYLRRCGLKWLDSLILPYHLLEPKIKEY